MLRTIAAPAILLAGLSAGLASAQELQVEPLESVAPADAVAPEIAAKLNPTGFAVKRGSRTLMEVWTCKEWVAEAGSESDVIQYPFRPGELFGVIRFRSRGSDFRNQEVPRGVYTLRYARQPIDGNHVGTFETRDFLLLVSAEEDRTPAPMDVMALQDASTVSIAASHPGIFCLLKPQGEAKSQEVSIRHDQEHDWWIVRLQGKVREADAVRDQAVELVVVGFTEV